MFNGEEPSLEVNSSDAPAERAEIAASTSRSRVAASKRTSLLAVDLGASVTPSGETVAPVAAARTRKEDNRRRKVILFQKPRTRRARSAARDRPISQPRAGSGT
jgi:hypothetical protein